MQELDANVDVSDRLIAELRDLIDEHSRQLEIDDRRKQGLAAIDREVTIYKRKLAGLEPWTDFAAMVPANARATLEKAA